MLGVWLGKTVAVLVEAHRNVLVEEQVGEQVEHQATWSPATAVTGQVVRYVSMIMNSLQGYN